MVAGLRISANLRRQPNGNRRLGPARAIWLTEPPERHCECNQLPPLGAIDEASLRIIHLAIQVVWRDNVRLDAERRRPLSTSPRSVTSMRIRQPLLLHVLIEETSF